MDAQLLVASLWRPINSAPASAVRQGTQFGPLSRAQLSPSSPSPRAAASSLAHCRPQPRTTSSGHLALARLARAEHPGGLWSINLVPRRLVARCTCCAPADGPLQQAPMSPRGCQGSTVARPIARPRARPNPWLHNHHGIQHANSRHHSPNQTKTTTT